MKFIKHVLLKNGMSYLISIIIFNIKCFFYALDEDNQHQQIYLIQIQEVLFIQFHTWSPLKQFSGTLTQSSKSTSSVSDYLSGGKKPFTMVNNSNASVVMRNEAQSSKFGNE